MFWSYTSNETVESSMRSWDAYRVHLWFVFDLSVLDPGVDYARDLAKKQEAELVVHNKDGKISQKDSYGNDPCPPKDKE